jgi:hypothetical protein
MKPKPSMKSPIWTALFVHKYGVHAGCYNVEFGHPDGQPITFKTAVMLAKKYKQKRKRLSDYRFHCVVPHSRDIQGW